METPENRILFSTIKRSIGMWDQILAQYDKAVALCPNFERKGKSVPYTSANGYMFSLMNKEGEFGIRFSKEVQEKYMKELNTTYFKSHGATMKGYILIPERLLNEPETLALYLNESYEYVMTLKPK
jgi:hypothetical protein